VVAVCAFTCVKGIACAFAPSPKLGVSALREMLAKAWMPGAASHNTPPFGLHRLNSRLPGIVPGCATMTSRSRVACRNCVPAISATLGST
jgi:hypothetical protein